MRRFALLLVLLSAVASSSAAEPSTPPRVFPLPPVPVTPTPKPDPSAIPKLTKELFYCFDSDTPLLILSSPAGRVKIVRDAGPLRLRGKFLDGTGVVETREYKRANVYTVEALTDGRVELLAVPEGAKSEADVQRVAIDVFAGDGPRPPPVPPIPPDPPVPVTGLRVLIVYESQAALTREQLNILNSTAIVAYLNERTSKADGRPGWRKFDKDVDVSKETETWQKLWAATKPSLGKLPQIVIVTDQKGETFPLPETEAATLQLLKRYGGE